MVWVPNQLIGASIGSDALLVCNSDASPEPTNYWTKDDQEAITSSCKYEIEREVEGTSYQMILRIKNIEPSDYGLYKCFSRNSLGSTAGSIKVYG
jgi:neural cell adhesion molecule L1, putative (fragment)